MKKNIKNDFLNVDISSVGAELQSLKTIKDDVEYLWNGNSKYWGRHAPVLFPVVGTLLNNTYIHEGKSYEMNPHGFIRDCEFEIIAESENSVVFKVVSDEKSLENYPFDFEVQIGYKLEDNSIEIMHSVLNKGKEDMWFSIGEHPGFMCPLLKNETMNDYVLELEKNETIERWFLEDDLLTDKTEIFLENCNTVPLSHELFERKAIILKGLESNFVTLKSKNHNRKVTVTLKGYPYLGIWSISDAPFVCIEPWYGVASRHGGSMELKQKEGIMKLCPNEVFECGYKIIIE